jgi:hypothetical protein
MLEIDEVSAQTPEQITTKLETIKLRERFRR